MKLRNSLLALSVALSLIVSLGAGADDKVVKLAATEWPPYVGKQLKEGGFTTAIIKAIFVKMGYTVEVNYYPWKRVLRSVEDKKADAAYPAYFSQERATIYDFSNEFAHGPLVFFVRKDKLIAYETLSDLEGRKIGVVRGYANTEEFDQADYLTKMVSDNDASNLRSLLIGRLDLAVSDRFTGLHILQTQFQDKAHLVQSIDPPLAEKSLHLLFPKDSPRHRQLMTDFNAGLALLQDAGEVKQILQRFGF